MRLQKLLAIVGLGLAGVSAHLHAQLGPNLVVNGSFEEPVSTNNWGSNPSTWFTNQTIPGWRITQGSIDLVRSTLQGGFQSPYDGFQVLDLNGTRGLGGISQSISISDSGIYRLQFAMSANTVHEPSLIRSLRLTLSSANFNFSQVYNWNLANHPTHTSSNIQWELHSIDLNLPIGNYNLEFVSLTNDSMMAHGPLLDDVQLRLVPEPASLLALGAGLAGLAGLKKRKR